MAKNHLFGSAAYLRDPTRVRTAADGAAPAHRFQPKRAEVILAGACIVLMVMHKLGKVELTVSDRGCGTVFCSSGSANVAIGVAIRRGNN